jgi:hypothetical protein
MPLPATALLSNRATWAVPARYLPAVAAVMLSTPSLSYEKYDLGFKGQHLKTTYFDTLNIDLVKARKQGDRYLTLRVRCYQAEGAVEAYALAGKTEAEKWRVALTPDQADAILEGLVQGWLDCRGRDSGGIAVVEFGKHYAAETNCGGQDR